MYTYTVCLVSFAILQPVKSRFNHSGKGRNDWIVCANILRGGEGLRLCVRLPTLFGWLSAPMMKRGESTVYRKTILYSCLVLLNTSLLMHELMRVKSIKFWMCVHKYYVVKHQNWIDDGENYREQQTHFLPTFLPAYTLRLLSKFIGKHWKSEKNFTSFTQQQCWRSPNSKLIFHFDGQTTSSRQVANCQQ